LQSNEAHVWLTRLDAENVIEMESIISEEERARAERFRFEPDKKRFIAARGRLRIILGKYLQINPRLIRFEYGEFGKPSIAGECNSEIKFNLSHSNEMALCAVTRDREIGVDIERIKSSIIDDGMILQCLTAHEKTFFQALPKNKRDLFFFECWTRKEAFLKARGDGLLFPVNQIETLSFSTVSTNLFNGDCGFRPSGWSFLTIPFIPGYAAALTVKGSSPTLSFWQ
jgi:4'-phosphopantetheinyl transferase